MSNILIYQDWMAHRDSSGGSGCMSEPANESQDCIEELHQPDNFAEDELNIFDRFLQLLSDNEEG